eukprot:1234483-Rhodomonas_salina.2
MGLQENQLMLDITEASGRAPMPGCQLRLCQRRREQQTGKKNTSSAVTAGRRGRQRPCRG